MTKAKLLPEHKRSAIEATYNRLEGEYKGFLEVARLYEHKVPHQDREDIRHTIIEELATARLRDGEPLPRPRACRIASFMIADYWRNRVRFLYKVCVYNGYATELKCRICKHRPQSGKCAWLAMRPLESLESEIVDNEGNVTELKDTIADDKAIDLDAWLDANTWLLGCPKRLVEIAHKIKFGSKLTKNDHKYLWKYRKKDQRPLF